MLLHAPVGMRSVNTNLSVGFFQTLRPSHVFHVRLLAVQLFSFPAGTFLTLTSRVYQPPRTTKDPEANSLFSQVLEKTNRTLWEPLPPLRESEAAPRLPGRPTAVSLRAQVQAGVRLPATAGPERVRRRVKVLSELHGNIKITPHSGRHARPTSLQWQKKDLT